MAESSKYFVHPAAIVESTAEIGAGTRVWAFAHVLSGARIGRDCNLCDGVFVEGDVVIGNRVTIKCGVQLWSGVRVEDDVFIGPNATFTNDRFPRSGRHLPQYPATILQAGCSVGANATILPGLTLGRSCLVGAGAVVTRNVPPHAIVTGNPAEIVGYDEPAGGIAARNPSASESRPLTQGTSVTDVRLYETPLIEDLRGDLTVGDFDRHVPFQAKRYFFVFNVKNREIRGQHAHRTCKQFLICVSGSCWIAVDDGRRREQFFLDSPRKGIFLPARIWGTQFRFSSDSRLLVFASELYDPADYIRDYDEFLRFVADGG